MTQPKSKGGRPRYVPDEKDRRTVRAMLSYGMTQDEVALAVGIDAKTLRRHFPAEIRTAAVQANAQVRRALFRTATDWMNEVDAAGKATGRPSKESTTAAIWWDKTHGGAVEKLAVDARHSGRIDSKVEAKAEISVGLNEPAARAAELLDQLAARLAAPVGAAAGLA